MSWVQDDSKKTTPEVDHFIYIKVGRRYHKLRDFNGFPSDGVWLVTSKGCSSRCVVRDINVTKLAEIPPAAVTERMALELRKDEVVKALSEARAKRAKNIGMSDNDLVNTIFDALSGIDKHKDS